jgi:hypothetical protein
MNCFQQFFSQILETVTHALPTLVDWLVSRLHG